jgi:hypothetical protein
MAVNTMILANKNKHRFLQTLVMNAKPSLLNMYFTMIQMIKKNKEYLAGNNKEDEFVREMIQAAQEKNANIWDDYKKKSNLKIPSKFKYKDLQTTQSGNLNYIDAQKNKAKNMIKNPIPLDKWQSGDSRLIGNVIMQLDGGDMFEGYFRYTPFVVHPKAQYLCMGWTFGTIQLSKNPFIKGENPINLNDVFWKDIMPKYEKKLNELKVSLYDIKMSNEKKILSDGNNNAIGFSLLDIEALMGKKIENNRDEVESAMSKFISNMSSEDKTLLTNITVPVWDIIKGSSGGHHDIANLSGFAILSFIDKDLPKKFTIAIMRDVANIMKDKSLNNIAEPNDYPSEAEIDNVKDLLPEDEYQLLKDKGNDFEPIEIELLNKAFQSLKEKNKINDEWIFTKHPKQKYSFYDVIVSKFEGAKGNLPYIGIELETAFGRSRNWHDGKTPLSFLKRKLFYFDYDTEKWVSPKEDYFLKRIFYMVWKDDLTDAYMINMYDLLNNHTEKFVDIKNVQDPRAQYFLEIPADSKYVIWGIENCIKKILEYAQEKYVLRNNFISKIEWSSKADKKKSGMGNKGNYIDYMKKYYNHYKD